LGKIEKEILVTLLDLTEKGDKGNLMWVSGATYEVAQRLNKWDENEGLNLQGSFRASLSRAFTLLIKKGLVERWERFIGHRVFEFKKTDSSSPRGYFKITPSGRLLARGIKISRAKINGHKLKCVQRHNSI